MGSNHVGRQARNSSHVARGDSSDRSKEGEGDISRVRIARFTTRGVDFECGGGLLDEELGRGEEAVYITARESDKERTLIK